jgi:hypothetical protein
MASTTNDRDAVCTPKLTSRKAFFVVCAAAGAPLVRIRAAATQKTLVVVFIDLLL